MGETKTYIVPDQCSHSNDFATMAMLNNGGFGGNWANNPFMYLIWIYMMRWLNNGDQNDPAIQRQIQTLQDQISNNHSSDLVMQGINGNADAIRQLASQLGCDFNTLNAAVQGVSSGISQLGGQLGYSSERIINAINSGDCGVIQAVKDCCCGTQKAILEMGYQNQLANERQTYQLTNSVNSVENSMEKNFNNLSFQNQSQTCALQNTIKDTSTVSTNQILAKLDAIQNQTLLDKIDALREKNSEQAVIINNAQQSNLFSQMITAATAPINATLSGLTKEVSDIQCKLPNTVTLPYSCATAVPTQSLYNGLALSAWGGNCYNNSLWG